MSLKDRLNYFHNEVLTKNWVQAKQPHMGSQYARLYWARRITEFLFSGCLIFGGQQFLIVNGFFLPLWPATGVALAALFLRGNRLLAGIFVGSFASFFHNRLGAPTSLLLASLFCLQVFLIRQTALVLFGAIAPLANLRSYLGLLLCTLVFSSAYVVGFDVIANRTGLHLTLEQQIYALLGNLNGILCLVPLSLAFEPFVPAKYFNAQQLPWQLSALLVFLAHLLFFFLSPIACLALAFTLLIVMAVNAHRFGLIPICIAWLGISVLYLTGALPNWHLFQTDLSPVFVLSLIGLFSLNLILSQFVAVYSHH